MAEKRTLILSDTHMGRTRGLSPEDLRPLWRGFDRVVFNGDTAELQMPRLREVSERAVWRLREMADADGVELCLVCGNHDTDISETQHLTLMGGRVLVMHGHALHPGVAPWTRAGKAMSRLTQSAMAQTPEELARCIDERLRQAREVAAEGFALDPTTHRVRGMRLLDMCRRPQDAVRALHYWWSVPAMASAFAQRYCPKVEVFVLGHSHRQGVWCHGGRTVINTGCYAFPGRPRAVVVSGTTLEVHDVRRTPAGCELAAEARRSVTLPAMDGGDEGDEAARDRAA